MNFPPPLWVPRRVEATVEKGERDDAKSSSVGGRGGHGGGGGRGREGDGRDSRGGRSGKPNVLLTKDEGQLIFGFSVGVFLTICVVACCCLLIVAAVVVVLVVVPGRKGRHHG